MLLASNSKGLPGRPLLNLQYSEGLCTTSLRKSHAPIFGQDYVQLWICVGVFVRRLAKVLSRRLKIALATFGHFIGSRPWISWKLLNKVRENTRKSRFHRVIGGALGFGWRKQRSDVRQEFGVSRLGEHALASSLAKFAAVVATRWRG
jgi:hypothetical protein